MRSGTCVAPIPGFYVWQIPGESTSIQINLDVVDRLQRDVMQGFSAVPRRGAEVGGILLGAVEGASVRVEDYQLVPIEYRHGPSYRFSEHDRETFARALHPSQHGKTRAIGYFRSHTRKGTGLSDEDLGLLAQHFPQPETIVLLIRPFGVKPSLAGFYTKKDGEFRNGPPEREFPLRSQELAADRAPSPPVARGSFARIRVHSPSLLHPRPFLSLLLIGLLLFAVLLGYQTIRGARDPFRLGVSVQASSRNLKIQWWTQSPAIQSAQRGLLTIEDGSYKGVTNLTRSDLRTGSAGPYHPRTAHLRLRLDIFLNRQNGISETIEWQAPGGAKERVNE